MRIEINLLGGRQRKKKAGAKAFALPDFGALIRQVKDPLLLGAVGAWAVAVLVVGLLYLMQQRRMSSLTEQVEQSRAEARRFQNLMVQKTRAERLRDSLALELETIRRIDGDRYQWPHLLEEVTKALPDYTWLISLQPVPSAPTDAVGDTTVQALRFMIEGRTAEIAAYTRFIRQLEASAWVREVVPGATSTVMEETQPLTAFSVRATFRQADSAYIRTVPVAESIR
jgi:Tfp pilus assembly protein PilN